jgi:hypothetical protein
VVTPEQQKWVSKLLGYDYDIIYHPGKMNSAANALSRMPIRTITSSHDNKPNTSEELLAISGPHFQLWAELKQANTTEPYLVDLHQKLFSHPDQHPHLKNREGLLLSQFQNGRSLWYLTHL